MTKNWRGSDMPSHGPPNYNPFDSDDQQRLANAYQGARASNSWYAATGVDPSDGRSLSDRQRDERYLGRMNEASDGLNVYSSFLTRREQENAADLRQQQTAQAAYTPVPFSGQGPTSGASSSQQPSAAFSSRQTHTSQTATDVEREIARAAAMRQSSFPAGGSGQGPGSGQPPAQQGQQYGQASSRKAAPKGP
ncbi:hypothetical protein [Micromonospora yangpuensis]|nr:hypothetical protein [Micromonospora yangpuensis]